MISKVITDIATEPVSSTEAKLWCKVTGTTEDTLFTILIKAARQGLERFTNSSFAEKEIHAIWKEVPEDWLLELPYGPVDSIDKVYRIDEEGTETELTANVDYFVDVEGNVKLSVHYYSAGHLPDAYRVEYTAGYGLTNTETFPVELKQAILIQIANDYEFREGMAEGSVSALCNDAKSKASPYRRSVWFA